VTHEEWIRARVEVAGPLTRPREFPWSVVLRVPTRDGVVWFKENVPPLAFEAALVQLLTRRAPDRVPELVAVDVDRGWMLMRDAGTRLRDLVPDEAAWLELLPLYAQLQLAVAEDADALVAAGTPDRRVARIPMLFRDVVDAQAGSLAREETARLHEYALRVDGACGELAALAVPESIHHDDFHDGNVFVRDGRYRILDWGDASVSHPFATLRIPLEGLAEDTDWDLARLRDAYLEPFTSFAPRDDLVRAADAAWIVAGVTRALKWAPIIDSMPRPHEWEDAVPIRLRVLLED
jgi:hypothetical protein